MTSSLSPRPQTGRAQTDRQSPDRATESPAALAADPFTRVARQAVTATALAGIVVACAPWTPAGVRAPVLVLTLALWSTITAAAALIGLRRAWSPRPSGRALALAALGTAGIAMALLVVSQLELLRLVGGRPALTWQVDWRVAMAHAQAIARTGGVATTLDYPGTPIVYHVGPAWFAGAVGRVFGGGLLDVLFGLVPFICLLAIVLATLLLLRGHARSTRLAAAAIGIGLTLPGTDLSPRGIYASLPGALLDAELWPLGRTLMLNSYFALAVGLAALVLLAQGGWSVRRATGMLALGAVLVLKPQFFVGLGLLVGVIGIGRAIGAAPFAPRSFALLGAAAAALAAALAFRALGPSAPAQFAAPTLAPLRTGYPPADVIMLGTLVGLAALAVAALADHRRSPRGAEPDGAAEVLVGALVALFLLAGALGTVSFPVRPDLVARATTLGYRYYAAAEQWNLAQALRPLRALTVFAACTILGGVALRQSRRLRPLGLIAGLCVLSPLPLVLRDFAHPLRWREAAEDPGLYAVLQRVPRAGTLLIASDLSDPAEHSHRGLLGALLSGYAGHRVYVANLNHHIYVPPDALARVTALRRFFGAPWSPWHVAWLRRTGVTHVLIDDRCRPVWRPAAVASLREVARAGRWTAYAVVAAAVRPPSGPAPVPPPASRDLPARYGDAGCLSGVGYWTAAGGGAGS